MIFQPPLVQQIRAGKKTQTRRPAKDGEPCRYREGKSYAVQPGRGQSATCRIHVTAVRQEIVGEIAFADARAEGFPTTDDFKTYWVSVHDRAWLEHEKAMLDEAELDDGVVLDRDLWLARRSLDMFERRHARRPVWVITFTLHAEEEVRFLGASSPLVEGGKARLMSPRKVKPRPARPAHNPEAMSENEATGYVVSAARALPLEPEPVDRETQKRITQDAGMTTRQWQTVEQAHRDHDRALLSREDQIVRLQRAARLRSIDATRELWALQNMLKTAADEKFVAKVRKTEAKVFRVAA